MELFPFQQSAAVKSNIYATIIGNAKNFFVKNKKYWSRVPITQIILNFLIFMNFKFIIPNFN